MQENGWVGRPLVVAYDENRLQAWTGSHRLAAAEITGTPVPCIMIDYNELWSLVEESEERPELYLGPSHEMGIGDFDQVDPVVMNAIQSINPDVARLIEIENA